MKVVLNSKQKKVIAIASGVVVFVVVLVVIVYFATKVNPRDYQLYGKSMFTYGDTRVQYIVFVPEINQNVYMLINYGEADKDLYLKMVSEDNKQSRYTPAKPSDTASKLFDHTKWNNGYTDNTGDFQYFVIKPSLYEIYGPSANGSITVMSVIYVRDDAPKQAVYMAIKDGLLIMVTEDNTQARTVTASVSDTPESLFRYDAWEDYTVVDTMYLMRKK